MTGYNGWKNYETWNVALWIDNEQERYRHRCYLAQECWDHAESNTYLTRREVAQRDLADVLKDWIEDDNPLADDASMFSDLLRAALSEVDWHEIAANFLEDIDETEEEDSDETEEE